MCFVPPSTFSGDKYLVLDFRLLNNKCFSAPTKTHANSHRPYVLNQNFLICTR